MANLTVSKNRTEKEGRLIAFKVKGGTKILKNTIVCVDTDGYLIDGIEAGAVFAGISYEEADATGLNDGDVICRVERKRAWYFQGTGFTQADMLKTVYAANNNDIILAQTAAVEPAIGKIIEVVSATEVLVAINE